MEITSHRDLIETKMAKAIQAIEHNSWYTWEKCSDIARNRALKQAKECYKIAQDEIHPKIDVKAFQQRVRTLENACKKMLEAWDCRHPEAGIVAIEEALKCE